MSYFTYFFEKKSIKTFIYGVFIISLSMVMSACSSNKPSLDMATLQDEQNNKDLDNLSAVPQERPPLAYAEVAENTIKRGGGYAKVGKPYKIDGKWYYPERNDDYQEIGQASWYGQQFHGKTTANGETYDMYHFSAAHPTMPLPSYARITNLDNGSSMIVRVNDRGPYAKDRIIDLSMQAATMLGYKEHGTANVKVEYVGAAPIDGQDDAYLMASFQVGNGQSSVMQAMFDTKPATKNTNEAEVATKALISNPINNPSKNEDIRAKKGNRPNSTAFVTNVSMTSEPQPNVDAVIDINDTDFAKVSLNNL